MLNEELKNIVDNDNINYNAPEWKELYEYERNQSLIHPTPNNPPWNSWMAVGFWLVKTVIPELCGSPLDVDAGAIAHGPCPHVVGYLKIGRAFFAGALNNRRVFK